MKPKSQYACVPQTMGFEARKLRDIADRYRGDV